ncbi:MAG: DUF6295 family protein [Candidatus Dormibacteria bacterium]
MCTYQTEIVPLAGSGKGGQGWFPLQTASVYRDHPSHAPYLHTLNLDFLNQEVGPQARVALELTEDSARRLALAILAELAPSGPVPQPPDVPKPSGSAGA